MSLYKYTIIIPHHNIPDLLQRLLLSIPEREDLQVIVVDDCSSKDLDKLSNLKKKYTKVEWFKTENNGGGGKARNIGLKHAQGEFILFADADDFFLPNLNEVLDDYKSVHYLDIIFFSAISLNCENLKLSNRGRDWKKFQERFGKENLNLILRYDFGEPWCKLIKKNLIIENAIKFDETPIHNDTFFSYMIGYYAKDIFLDNRFIYCITDRPASVSKEINIDKLLIRTNIFAKKNKFLKDKNIEWFDYILIRPLLIYWNNHDLKEKMFKIIESYGFTKKEITKHICKFIISALKNRFHSLKVSISSLV